MSKQEAVKQILSGSPVSKYALVKKALQTEQGQLSEEAAHDQVMLFLDYYDIDIARVTPEALPASERSLDHLRDFIRDGRVEVRRGKDEKLEVVHNLTGGTQVIYGEVTAAAKLAMDRCPPEARYARVYALMGSLSSLGSAGIEKFPFRDLAVVDILGSLFMSA